MSPIDSCGNSYSDLANLLEELFTLQKAQLEAVRDSKFGPETAWCIMPILDKLEERQELARHIIMASLSMPCFDMSYYLITLSCMLKDGNALLDEFKVGCTKDLAEALAMWAAALDDRLVKYAGFALCSSGQDVLP